MASVRIAICVDEGSTTVKDPFWIWNSNGHAVLMPSVSFDCSDLLELERRVIREVMATFKAFHEKNRKEPIAAEVSS